MHLKKIGLKPIIASMQLYFLPTKTMNCTYAILFFRTKTNSCTYAMTCFLRKTAYCTDALIPKLNKHTKSIGAFNGFQPKIVRCTDAINSICVFQL